MAKKDGGSAFPMADVDIPHYQFGMTIRQYYKGQAMIGLLAGCKEGLSREYFGELANESGMIADCMIAEDEEFAREEKPNE